MEERMEQIGNANTVLDGKPERNVLRDFEGQDWIPLQGRPHVNSALNASGVHKGRKIS
jgi:hypothetical protein